MKIKAVVAHEFNQPIAIEDVELDAPKNDEVLVKMVATGMCHADIIATKFQMVPLPAVLGHEGAGVVEEVGPGVNNISVGDHVVLTVASCGECDLCLSGHPAECRRVNELNFGGAYQDGTKRLHQGKQDLSNYFGQASFATHAIVNKRSVVKVDPKLDLKWFGPLGCGFSTGAGAVLNVFKPGVGSSIAVFGTGAVGLAAIMAAKMINLDKIIAIDIHDNRLELAKELGATDVINSRKLTEAGDIAEAIKKVTDGKGVNYSLDTTGIGMITHAAIKALDIMGTAGVIAATQELTFNFTADMLADNRRLIAITQGDSIPQLFIPKLIKAYQKGLFPFDRLVKFYPLSDINQAMEDSLAGSTIKPILMIE
ncbi:NAD(P)-dependent alcohol dehydrogenase [Paucilactobacillus kaifaensis]|uniref:NAD(P)-dependent alcohol dehydrogenase n=1 Tax=Paucilactobacillus kaifaensis TaxID=2559921 RepID=UPI0010FA41CC|nr:NAD(P)-dependent alcohol dehydrogenase [Paucilactobacillus kaifaensis]